MDHAQTMQLHARVNSLQARVAELEEKVSSGLLNKDVVSEPGPRVWAKDIYAEADRVYSEALTADVNDRMSALSMTVDHVVELVKKQAAEELDKHLRSTDISLEIAKIINPKVWETIEKVESLHLLLLSEQQAAEESLVKADAIIDLIKRIS